MVRCVGSGRRVRWGLTGLVVASVALGLVTSGLRAEPVHRRAVVLVDRASGRVDRSFPDFDATTAVAALGGGFIVGSDYLKGLVRLTSEGRRDRAWSAVALRRSTVLQLERSGRTVIARAVSARGGRQVVEVVAVDVQSAGLLWRHTIAVPVGVFARVSSDVATLGGRVFVVGGFTSIAGVPRRFIAALDARSGRVLPWTGPRFTGVPRPRSPRVAAAGSRIYVAGDLAFPTILALDARSGRADRWRPRTRREIDSDNSLFATRKWVISGGQGGLEVFRASDGGRVAWPPVIGSAITFATDRERLYVGGNLQFRFVGGGLNNLAALDPRTGRLLAWAPQIADVVSISEVVENGDRVLVVGDYWDVG